MENGMRILGLDFGSKTVGVAVTDPLGYTAQGVEIIRRDSPNKLRKTLARIEQLVEQYNIEKIVLGYPVMLSGTEGERVKKTKEFGAMLERRTGLEIVFQDERLTTVEAYEIMDEAGIKKQDRYKYVDQIAATIILEDYINRIEKEHIRLRSYSYYYNDRNCVVNRIKEYGEIYLMEEKIVLTDDEGNEVEMYVVEETRINNVNYILVTEEGMKRKRLHIF